MNIKIELHTADGQVIHAIVSAYPKVGELVVSEHGHRFEIGEPGHEYQNYPYRMYKAKPFITPKMHAPFEPPA